jgi:hypothetical protein
MPRKNKDFLNKTELIELLNKDGKSFNKKKINIRKKVFQMLYRYGYRVRDQGRIKILVRDGIKNDSNREMYEKRPPTGLQRYVTFVNGLLLNNPNLSYIGLISDIEAGIREYHNTADKLQDRRISEGLPLSESSEGDSGEGDSGEGDSGEGDSSGQEREEAEKAKKEKARKEAAEKKAEEAEADKKSKLIAEESEKEEESKRISAAQSSQLKRDIEQAKKKEAKEKIIIEGMVEEQKKKEAEQQEKNEAAVKQGLKDDEQRRRVKAQKEAKAKKDAEFKEKVAISKAERLKKEALEKEKKEKEAEERVKKFEAAESREKAVAEKANKERADKAQALLDEAEKAKRTAEVETKATESAEQLKKIREKQEERRKVATESAEKREARIAAEEAKRAAEEAQRKLDALEAEERSMFTAEKEKNLAGARAVRSELARMKGVLKGMPAEYMKILNDKVTELTKRREEMLKNQRVKEQKKTMLDALLASEKLKSKRDTKKKEAAEEQEALKRLGERLQAQEDEEIDEENRKLDELVAENEKFLSENEDFITEKGGVLSEIGDILRKQVLGLKSDLEKSKETLLKRRGELDDPQEAGEETDSLVAEQLKLRSTEQQKKTIEILDAIDELNANSQPREAAAVEKTNEKAMVANTQLGAVPLEQSFEQQDNTQAAQEAQLKKQPGKAVLKEVDLGIPRLSKLNRAERDRPHQVEVLDDGGNDQAPEIALAANQTAKVVERAKRRESLSQREIIINNRLARLYDTALELVVGNYLKDLDVSGVIFEPLEVAPDIVFHVEIRVLISLLSAEEIDIDALIYRLDRYVNLIKDAGDNTKSREALLFLIYIQGTYILNNESDNPEAEALRQELKTKINSFSEMFIRVRNALELAKENIRLKKAERKFNFIRKVLDRYPVPVVYDGLLDTSESLGANAATTVTGDIEAAVEDLTADIQIHGVDETNRQYIIRLIKILSNDTKNVVIDVLRNDPLVILNPRAVIQPLLYRFLSRIIYSGRRVGDEEAIAYIKSFPGRGAIPRINREVVRGILAQIIDEPPELPPELRRPEEREPGLLASAINRQAEELADLAIDIDEDELIDQADFEENERRELARLERAQRVSRVLITDIIAFDFITNNEADDKIIIDFLMNKIKGKPSDPNDNLNDFFENMPRDERREYAAWVRRLQTDKALLRNVTEPNGEPNPLVTLITRSSSGVYSFTQRFLNSVRRAALNASKKIREKKRFLRKRRKFVKSTPQPNKPQRPPTGVTVSESKQEGIEEEGIPFEFPGGETVEDFVTQGVNTQDVELGDLGKMAQAAATVAAFGDPTPAEEIGIFRQVLKKGLDSLPSTDSLRDAVTSSGKSISDVSRDIASRVMPTIGENSNIASNMGPYIAVAIAGIIAVALYNYLTTSSEEPETKEVSRGSTTEFYKGKEIPVSEEDKDKPVGQPLLRPEFKMLGIDFFDDLYSRKTFGEQNSEWAHFDFVKAIDNSNGIEIDNNLNEKIRFSGNLPLPKFVAPNSRPSRLVEALTEYPMMSVNQVDQAFRNKFDSSINKFDNLSDNVNRNVLPGRWQQNILYNI